MKGEGEGSYSYKSLEEEMVVVRLRSVIEGCGEISLAGGHDSDFGGGVVFIFPACKAGIVNDMNNLH